MDGGRQVALVVFLGVVHCAFSWFHDKQSSPMLHSDDMTNHNTMNIPITTIIMHVISPIM
jgi:hypothetical protein